MLTLLFSYHIREAKFDGVSDDQLRAAAETGEPATPASTRARTWASFAPASTVRWPRAAMWVNSREEWHQPSLNRVTVTREVRQPRRSNNSRSRQPRRN